MELFIPPYDINRGWMKGMIDRGRKTGAVFVKCITVSGWPTTYALKNLKRGDLVGAVGSLSMMNSRESKDGTYILQEKIGIRIEKIEKIMGNAIKKDRNNIPRAPTMMGSPQQYNRQDQKEPDRNIGSYGMQEPDERFEKENGILDDTEFNFED